MIDVRLFATLRAGREKAYSLSCTEFKTVRDICTFLGIPVDDVAIILINGFHSNPDAELKDGDVLSLFPPCAGG